MSGSGLFRFAGAVININGVAPAPPNLELTAGLLTGGNLEVGGSVSWTGGTMTGSGATDILSTGRVVLDGNLPKVVSQRRQ